MASQLLRNYLKKRIADQIAFLISAVTSPFLVIAVFSLYTIGYFSANFRSFVILSAVFIGLSVILPFLYVVCSVKLGKITDVHVALREQREAPFKVAIVGSLFVLIAFYFMHVPVELFAMAFALLVNGVIFIFLTKYWKVSMHAASLASAVTIAGLLASSNAFWLYFLLIPVAWARIYRGKHTIRQIILAAFASTAVTAAILLLIK